MSDEQLTCAVCGKPSFSRCGKCRRITYCSKEHQKLDWKAHKAKCERWDTCFEIAENSELGRHLVASRTFREGEIILEEAPLVSGPLQETPPICLGCYVLLNEFNSKNCSRCGWPVCSTACEESSSHAPECEITRKYKNEKVNITTFREGLCHPTYQCLTVLRCLHLRRSNEEVWNKIAKLQSHYEELKSSKIYEDNLLPIALFIPRFFNFHEFEVEEILKVTGIVQINAHHVPLMQPGYVSIYDKASFLEHSCRANCSKSFTNRGNIVIRAARIIHAGERLSISYTLPLWGAKARRAHLLQTKYFLCQCERCTDPTELGTHFNSFRCSSEDCCGYNIPVLVSGSSYSFWRCLTCGNTTSDEDLKPFFRNMEEDILKLDKRKVEDCKSFLQKYGKSLHPNHHSIVEVELAILQCHEENLFDLKDEDLRWMIETCRNLNKLADHLLPAENRLRGILYFHLHSALAECDRRMALTKEVNPIEVKRNLTICKEVLKKVHALLKNEPDSLPEGRMSIEALRYIQNIDTILECSEQDAYSNK